MILKSQNHIANPIYIEIKTCYNRIDCRMPKSLWYSLLIFAYMQAIVLGKSSFIYKFYCLIMVLLDIDYWCCEYSDNARSYI